MTMVKRPNHMGNTIYIKNLSKKILATLITNEKVKNILAHQLMKESSERLKSLDKQLLVLNGELDKIVFEGKINAKKRTASAKALTITKKKLEEFIKRVIKYLTYLTTYRDIVNTRKDLHLTNYSNQVLANDRGDKASRLALRMIHANNLVKSIALEAFDDDHLMEVSENVAEFCKGNSCVYNQIYNKVKEEWTQGVKECQLKSLEIKRNSGDSFDSKTQDPVLLRETADLYLKWSQQLIGFSVDFGVAWTYESAKLLESLKKRRESDGEALYYRRLGAVLIYEIERQCSKEVEDAACGVLTFVQTLGHELKDAAIILKEKAKIIERESTDRKRSLEMKAEAKLKSDKEKNANDAQKAAKAAAQKAAVKSQSERDKAKAAAEAAAEAASKAETEAAAEAASKAETEAEESSHTVVKKKKKKKKKKTVEPNDIDAILADINDTYAAEDAVKQRSINTEFQAQLDVLISELDVLISKPLAIRSRYITLTRVQADCIAKLKKLVKPSNVNFKGKNDRTILCVATYYGDLDLVNKILNTIGVDLECKNDSGFTPLMIAAQVGRVEILKKLIKSGANIARPTKMGLCPMMIAVMNEHSDIVDILLKAGVDVSRIHVEGISPLMAACKSGVIGVVDLLLKAHADVNEFIKPKRPIKLSGYSPLMFSVEAGHAGVVKKLLKAGAKIIDANNPKLYPLPVAAENGHDQVVEILLGAGAEVNQVIEGDSPASGYSPLLLAAQHGHTDVLKCLINNHANVNQRIERGRNEGGSALLLAVMNGKLSSVKLLIENGSYVNAVHGDGWSSLLVAVDKGHEDVVDLLLLNKNIDLNHALERGCHKGFNAFTIAAMNGYPNILSRLLKKGFDVNQVIKNDTHDGFTPLMAAAFYGNIDVLSLLLNEGADISAIDADGSSALMWATNPGHTEAVKTLIEFKADVNSVAVGEITPLMIASLNGYPETVGQLLETGADISAIDSEGFSPLLRALENEHTEVASLLLSNGADAHQIIEKGSYKGYSALMIVAEKNGSVELVKMLIDKDVKISTTNDDGDSALTLAEKNGYTEVVELLKEADTLS